MKTFGPENSVMLKKGIIFELQRYSIHDGPGIRTLVFMKGCPLRCLWCANPEGISPLPELMVRDSLCIHDQCRRCLNACPAKAIEVNVNGKLTTERELCKNCKELSCADACYAKAVIRIGKEMTVKELLEYVQKDAAYYRTSKGGVTLSGGEPTSQADYVAEFLKESQKIGLHTAIETCGYFNWKHTEEIIKHLDLIFYDLKQMDARKHYEFTGRSNELIVGNAKKISMAKIPMVIRTPIVPGYTDSEENITAVVNFARSLSSVEAVELLPYHRLAINKYQELGREYPLAHVRPPSTERMEKLKSITKLYYNC